MGLTPNDMRTQSAMRTAGKIIQARQNNTPSTTTTTTTRTRPRVSEYISTTYKNDETPITKGIRDIDVSSLGGNFGSADMSVVHKQAKQVTDKIKPEEKAQGGAAVLNLSRDQVAPSIRINSLMSSLYDEAEDKGINTAGQFSAAFKDLLKSKKINQDDVKFLYKYGRGSETGEGEGSKDIMDIDKLKRTAGEHFARMKQARDAAFNNQQSQATTTQTATPATTPATIQAAQTLGNAAPASVKLRVPNK